MVSLTLRVCISSAEPTCVRPGYGALPGHTGVGRLADQYVWQDDTWRKGGSLSPGRCPGPVLLTCRRLFHHHTDTAPLLHHFQTLTTRLTSSNNRLDGLVIKASAFEAEDPGFESRLRRDFLGRVMPVTLKKWHSSSYPDRRLAL